MGTLQTEIAEKVACFGVIVDSKCETTARHNQQGHSRPKSRDSEHKMSKQELTSIDNKIEWKQQ